TQALRLLSACPAVISATSAGAITAGHARALVALPSSEAQEQGLKVVLTRNLSVREIERWVKEYKPSLPRRRPARPVQMDAHQDAELADVIARLRERYGQGADIVGNRSRGQITFHYADPEGLDRLVDMLVNGPWRA